MVKKNKTHIFYKMCNYLIDWLQLLIFLLYQITTAFALALINNNKNK